MFQTEIKGIHLNIESNSEVFSPSAIDKGTLAMLSQVDFQSNDRVLDLGCGCGIVGLVAASMIGQENVTLCDVSPIAVKTSQENGVRNGLPNLNVVLSDGLNGIEETGFTKILSNPPYHVDFSVPKNFIEKGFKKLAVGGQLYMVTKRLDWYKNKITSVFGGVKVLEIDGYYVFIAQKRPYVQKKKESKNLNLSKKLARKMERRK